MTLEQAAHIAGIAYQYLSGVETGKKNFTISVLEKIAGALGIDLHALVVLAYASAAPPTSAREVDRRYFRPQVPLPPGLTVEHIAAAMNRTQSIIHRINESLRRETGKQLVHFVQGNNFSGLVSNILTDSINDNSPYKRISNQRYPDLVYPSAAGGRDVGLEVKATTNIGKGGESHNGHGGWHLVACYRISDEGDIAFVHIMLAVLNGHQHASSDWKYIGSAENPETGSRRTETYVTNLQGTTKLRDGSVFLDRSVVDCTRWRQRRPKGEKPPPWSIFCDRTLRK